MLLTQKTQEKCDLRNYSILKLRLHIPDTVFFKIIKFFFYDGLNSRKITTKLENEYNNKINSILIEKLLKSKSFL